MSQVSVSHCFSNNFAFRIESLPFTEIPGQSRLFTDYQRDPLSLAEFYPEAVESHTRIADRIENVLANYRADRGVLCDALEEMNRAGGAGRKTLENIAMLRDDDCVAVVSGQQAGLFSGPLYTIYKALSAVKMTECLRGRGFKAVPVFWIATEDHDFDEVSRATVIDRHDQLSELHNEPPHSREGLPVGAIQLDGTIRETLTNLFDSLPATEHTAELRELIESTWTPEEYYGGAFARQISRLFEKFGLIVLCPLDERLKRLASPVYVEAIEKSGEIVDALRARSERLVEAGYHAQVHVGEDYFPLFWQAPDRTRHALKRSADGLIWTKDNTREFKLEELAAIARNEPTRFSPSVVLRSVVQDYILPTALYFGGAAEIAYFAQSGEVYRILGRPQTPILHRQSFTVVESRHAKTLDRFRISLTDLFSGLEALLPRIVEDHLSHESARAFATAEENINIELNRLDQMLAETEPTLAENLAKRRRKVLYHIGALRTKFHHAQIRRDESVRSRLDAMFTAIMPHKHLQERSLNVAFFLNRYGASFVDWVYDAIDLDDKAHRVLYL